MPIKIISRRIFLKFIGFFMFFISLIRIGFSALDESSKKIIIKSGVSKIKLPIETDINGISYVYLVKGFTPEENVKRAIKIMGGIEKFIGLNDIVILKPNAQWWNQGTTNTNNIKGFIELLVQHPKFKGEVIIAENHHYKENNSRGWNTEHRNGDFNLNELVEYFNNIGHKNISKYHWVDGGPNPDPKEGDAGNGKIVNSVLEADGYVWMKDNIYHTTENRKCMMTYPVFTSPYSGIKIDLHLGSFHNGSYINNVKLINFSCLNHHSKAFGVTASIKNLMGIPDMTCGYQGTQPNGFFNIHFIGKMSKTYQAGIDMKYYGRKYGFGDLIGNLLMKSGYWNTRYTGGALGFWMKTVRKPDLNILAAEYVGWGGRGRKSANKCKNTNCVAISTDPLALDYVGAKDILLPATPKEEKVYRKLNDPDLPPFADFLEECNSQKIGNLDPINILTIKEGFF